MDTIKCMADGEEYSVWQFNQLTPEQLEKFRRQLICLSCGANTYYRKKSRMANLLVLVLALITLAVLLLPLHSLLMSNVILKMLARL